MKYYIGCSGFYYKEWKDIFYPKGLAGKDWFTFYCRHFNTIEINSSFYRTPSVSSLRKWYQDSPSGFLFSVKAPKVITHIKRFDSVSAEVESFYNLLSDSLQEKLGNILFQMPPSFSYTAERLQFICEQLNPAYNNVIEFRHLSWWQEEIIDYFAQNKITFCGHSYPGTIPDDVIINNESVYYRFHGKPLLYKSVYPRETLEHMHWQIRGNVKKVFIYFNNTLGEAALINSRQMQDLIA